MDVTYSSPKGSKHKGVIAKSVTVYSNDSANPTAKLSIKSRSGDENFRFEVTPEEADFGDLLPGKKEQLKIVLKNTDSTTSNLIIVDSPYFELIKKTKIKRLKLKPGQKTDIQFYLADIQDLGRFFTTLTLEADGKPGTRITIPVTGNVVAKLPEPKEKASN